MSAKLMGECYELDFSSFATDTVRASSLKQVLQALADHAHHDGTSAKPSVALIAWKTDLSTRSVQRALSVLEAAEIITADGVTNRKGGRAPTEWLLNLTIVPRKKAFVPLKGRQPVTPDNLSPVPDRRPSGDKHVSYEPSVEPSETTSLQVPAAEIIKHPRVDEVWDELAAQFGPPGTRQAEKERGKVCQQIRGAGVEHAADVVELVAEYRRTFSGEVALTQHALAKHADLLAHRIRERGSRRQAKPCEFCGVGGGLHAAECPEAEAA